MTLQPTCHPYSLHETDYFVGQENQVMQYLVLPQNNTSNYHKMDKGRANLAPILCYTDILMYLNWEERYCKMRNYPEKYRGEHIYERTMKTNKQNKSHFCWLPCTDTLIISSILHLFSTRTYNLSGALLTVLCSML